MERPNKWVLLEFEQGYKVFGSWSGGYLDGCSWRLNSGIKKVTRDSDLVTFHGYSGSKYVCHMHSYGIAGIGNVSVVKTFEDLGAEVLREEEAMRYIAQRVEA